MTKSIVEVIKNPNSSGQGYDDLHKNHPLHPTVTKHGYQYSHTTPVHQHDGTVHHVHTYASGEHKLSVHGHSLDWKSKVSSASGHSHVGAGVAALEKHLQNKVARYPELRQHLNEITDDGVNSELGDRFDVMKNYTATKDSKTGLFHSVRNPVATPEATRQRHPPFDLGQHLLDKIETLCRNTPQTSLRVLQNVPHLGFAIQINRRAANVSNLYAPDAMREVLGSVERLVRDEGVGSAVVEVLSAGATGADNPALKEFYAIVRVLLRGHPPFSGPQYGKRDDYYDGLSSKSDEVWNNDD